MNLNISLTHRSKLGWSNFCAPTVETVEYYSQMLPNCLYTLFLKDFGTILGCINAND